MAQLLYRLGRFSARRAWVVIVAWLLALAAAGGGFLLAGGTLASSFSIPGTETEQVTDQLGTEISGVDGANGTVVFTTADGSALDDGQRGQISSVLSGLTELDGVADVVDPFATEEQRADHAQQAKDGAAQLAAGKQQLDAGQQQLDAGRQQLDAAQQQLDAALAQASAAGAVPARLQAQKAQLDAQRAGLTDQQVKLEPRV